MKENLNFTNIINIEKNFDNIKFKKCFDYCIENNKDNCIINNAYQIKDKIYNDFDDKKYCLIQSQCFSDCMNYLK